MMLCMMAFLLVCNMPLRAWLGAQQTPMRAGRIAYVENVPDGEVRDYFDAQSYDESQADRDTMALREAGETWE